MKTLVIIDEHADLKEIIQGMKTKETFMDKKVQDMKEKMKAEIEKYEENKKEDWNAIENLDIIKSKLPSSYNSQTHIIGINREAGIVYTQTKESIKPSMQDFLKGLFN